MWKYSDLSSAAARAQQLWMILVGLARNRQTITYEDLAVEMGMTKRSARFLGNMLGPVYYYCQKNKLPPLTVLAIKKNKGVPGDGFSPRAGLARQRESVFDYPWYTICIPSRITLSNSTK